MQVNKTSPISATERPYLAKWDSAARRYFGFFEASKVIASDNVRSL